MIRIALTGGIGCGKSTACDFFTQLNVPVIDTDIIARELVEPHQIALKEIVDYFGSGILLNNGQLDRKQLSEKIFKNKKDKLHLESILHPKIRICVEKKLNQLNCCYAIIAIPLLIETSQQNNYDRVLLIDCDEQIQIARTLSRDDRDVSEIMSIIKSQASREDKLTIANDVIDNSTERSILQNQINQLHSKYMQLCD